MANGEVDKLRLPQYIREVAASALIKLAAATRSVSPSPRVLIAIQIFLQALARAPGEGKPCTRLWVHLATDLGGKA